MQYVRVTDTEDSDCIEIPTEDDGTLSFAELVALFPGVTALKYCLADGRTRAIKLTDGKLHPPENNWGNRIYRCVIPKGTQASQSSQGSTPPPNAAAANQSIQIYEIPPELSIQNEKLRRNFYCAWANSKRIDVMFSTISQKMKRFVAEQVIDGTKDILFSFFGNDRIPSGDEKVQQCLDILPGEKRIFDHCLHHPLLVSEKIMSKFERNAVCSNFLELGYQHIYRHKMVDTDQSDSSIMDILSSTSSCDDVLEGNEGSSKSRKRRKVEEFKTCQKKIYMDCDGLLEHHDINFTTLHFTETKVEVLVLLTTSQDICRKLATHLGLIFVEEMFEKIKINAKPDDVYQRYIEKTAKIYALFQNYIAKSMIVGNNNIVLTCSGRIFCNMKSDIKCIIADHGDKTKISHLMSSINMIITVNNNSFLHYVSAIADIVDFVLQCKSHLRAVYSVPGDDGKKKYEICNIPPVGIIPLYILKFFVKKKLLGNTELSLF